LVKNFHDDIIVYAAGHRTGKAGEALKLVTEELESFTKVTGTELADDQACVARALDVSHWECPLLCARLMSNPNGGFGPPTVAEEDPGGYNSWHDDDEDDRISELGPTSIAGKAIEEQQPEAFFRSTPPNTGLPRDAVDPPEMRIPGTFRSAGSMTCFVNASLSMLALTDLGQQIDLFIVDNFWSKEKENITKLRSISQTLGTMICVSNCPSPIDASPAISEAMARLPPDIRGQFDDPSVQCDASEFIDALLVALPAAISQSLTSFVGFLTVCKTQTCNGKVTNTSKTVVRLPRPREMNGDLVSTITLQRLLDLHLETREELFGTHCNKCNKSPTHSTEYFTDSAKYLFLQVGETNPEMVVDGQGNTVNATVQNLSIRIEERLVLRTPRNETRMVDLQTSEVTYKVIGVIHRIGIGSSGHFTTHSCIDGTWWHTDDESVRSEGDPWRHPISTAHVVVCEKM
jgi:hypothetical protein